MLGDMHRAKFEREIYTCAVFARREFLPLNTRHIVRLVVVIVMSDGIHSRLRDIIPGNEFLSQFQSPFVK
jgi:hypothetical protein